VKKVIIAMDAKHSFARSQPRRYAQLPRYFRWFSNQCVLRQLDESDVARIWEAATHPAFASCGTLRIPAGEDEVGDFVQKAQADWQRGTRYTMAVSRKQTQEFIGWVELRASDRRGAWVLGWFIHPNFVTGSLAQEATTAAADLMFNALEATTLFANCSRQQKHFEQMLNNAGFIELVPAGSLDHLTGRPRALSLFELGRVDWQAMQARAQGEADSTFPSWAHSGARLALELI